MNTLLNLGKGKLTNLLALIAVVYGIVGLIFGIGEVEINIAAIYTGATVFGLRRAIK